MKRPAPPPSTRDGLLAAAVKLIRAAGDAGEVTVRRIVQAAGTNLNAVNYHFGSKENLIREAVREIIRDWFRSEGVPPEGAGDAGVFPTARLASAFLFAEPVASRLALDAEIGARGAGRTLTRETMDALARLLAASRPGLRPAEVRLRTWILISAIHQVFLRPEECKEWLGVDPADASARAALLRRLVALAER